MKQGSKHSASSLYKIREARSKQVFTQQSQQKKRIAMLGNKNSLGFKHSDETRRKKSLSLIGNTRSLGYKHSLETRKKMSRSRTGPKHHFFGKKFSDEYRKKISEGHINNPNRKFKDTGIELKVEAELKLRRIDFKKQVPISGIAIVDFLISKHGIIIQCDGCFYHNCKIHHPRWHLEAPSRDTAQDVFMKAAGYNVYRFWEHEINDSVEKCIDKIKLTT